MMRRQSIIALAIAVALGLFAVYLANAYWSAREANAADNQGGMVNVAVAAIPQPTSHSAAQASHIRAVNSSNSRSIG